MNKTDETKRQIIEFLQKSGHCAWSQQTIGVRGRTIAKNSRGIGDIVACIKPRGRHMEIECKTGTDRIRDDQFRHMLAIRRAGGWHIFVKDFDDFYSQFQTIQNI